MADSTPTVAVLIPSWDGKEHLETCLDALASQNDPGVSWVTWVFDNGSRDGTSEWLEDQHPRVRRLRSETNLGFAEAINRLVAAADGCEFVALLNNDTRPTPDWLASLVTTMRSAHDDVAAVSGLIVDWEGQRLDFARGAITFDGHAFQVGYRRLLSEVSIPKTGEELPFACGGNLLIRRDVFLAVGGLDASYFAYYEDVDLGWRLWLSGYRVVFCAQSRIHHHSSATSERLGLFHRGYLFERNAYLTAYKNLEETSWQRLMPAILLTLMHRTQTLMIRNNRGGEQLTVDPYAGLIASTGGSVASQGVESSESLAVKVRRLGWREAVRRFRRRLGRRLSGESAAVALTSEATLSQLRVLSNLLGNLDQAAESRRRVQAMRRRSDADYLKRFPLYLVPTYAGDEELFSSEGFRSWLPEDLPIEETSLQDLMEWP